MGFLIELLGLGRSDVDLEDVTIQKKIVLCFGALLYYTDIGTDIGVGLNFYNACHNNWAISSFLLTCLPIGK